MTEAVAIEPRLLTKAQAAGYIGLTPRNYDRLRKLGKVPGYVPGTARIDKRALDAALDDLSKLGKLIAPAPAPEDEDPLTRWSRDARRARKQAAEDRGRQARP